MKIFLSLFLFLFSEPVLAQFHTVHRERINYKVKIQMPVDSVRRDSLFHTSDSLDTDIPNRSQNRYSKLSIEQLQYFVNAFEKALDRKKTPISGLSAKIHKLYEGEKHELNLYNLMKVMGEIGLSNKLFVLAQAVLETGNFNSRVCREYNNLFGLFDSRNKDYFRFESWEDSVVGYKKMIQYRYKGGNYLRFLKQIRYAEDPNYIPKIAKTAKSLYERNSDLFKVQSSVKS